MMTSLLLPIVLSAGAGGTGLQATTPLACRAHALDPAQRKRQQELLALMRERAQAKEALPDGYAIRLPTDAALFKDAAEWISLERLCCPFVQFALEWKQDDTIWVRLTGGPGVKEFLDVEMP